MIEPPGVQVYGQRELVEHLESGGRHYSHCISIGNPGGGFGRPDTVMPRMFRRHFRRILRLAFYDAEKVNYLGTMRPRRLATGYTLHCWGGVSRSPAVALGIRYLISGSKTTSGDILRRIRPDTAPHQGIVRSFDELLGSNLRAVSDDIRAERIARMQRELDLTGDALLEELPGADGEE